MLRHYTYNVTLPVLRREIESLGQCELDAAPRGGRDATSRCRRVVAPAPADLAACTRGFRPFCSSSELKNLREGAHTSNERLLADFREQARGDSGIQVPRVRRVSQVVPGMSEPALA